MTGGDMPQPKELIGYRRAAALPGIEVLDAHHSSRHSGSPTKAI